MPEGPEIHRTADRLAEALTARKVRRVYFAFDHLKPFARRLRHKTVVDVQARGKAILTHFDSGYSLYTHNQLYGRWEVIRGDDYPPTSRSLRLAIHADAETALLYSASEIEILKTDELFLHPYLSRLGPDLLDPQTGAATVVERLDSTKYRRRALMGLLQDQGVIAGMGNYLCCEALYVTGIHPQQKPEDLSVEQLQQLAENCLLLTRQSYQTDGITNTLERAESLRRRGLAFEDYRFHVYRRAGQPCYRCGAGIVKDRFGGRMGYICPNCQQNP